MIWSQGKVLADDALRISARDRVFEHGLGLFETLRTWNGQPTLLPRHLNRLRRSASELRIPLDDSALPTTDDVRMLLHAEGVEGDAVLRITLTGGTSEQGGSVVWMRSGPIPVDRLQEGARLGTTGPARLDPLAGYKSLNYWPYRLLYERARDDGCDEALLVDSTGAIREGSRTNVFFHVRGRLVTAPCDGRILPGIMRGLVVERARGIGIDVDETPPNPLDPKFDPDEVFLTNAVRGIVAVRSWGAARFPSPGPTTARLWDDVSRWLATGGEL